MIEFVPFPKIGRLSQQVAISEKIDGTNAQVFIRPHEGNTPDGRMFGAETMHEGKAYELFAGSRTRWITRGKATDNYGFAGWVQDNKDELVKLGEGQHFGEWYGKGIQRGYGLNDKRFALFNSLRWRTDNPPPKCCDVVPLLFQGEMQPDTISDIMQGLQVRGSALVHTYMEPEGIVVYYVSSRTMFKKTFDDRHKEAA